MALPGSGPAGVRRRSAVAGPATRTLADLDNASVPAAFVSGRVALFGHRLIVAARHDRLR